MSLHKFLLARLGEESEELASMPEPPVEIPPEPDIPSWLVGRVVMDGERLRADVEARRQIVEEYTYALLAATDPGADDVGAGEAAGLGRATWLLAQPYRTHPDFDEAWAQ